MDENIELRSEPVRRIVGKMPPALVRQGPFLLLALALLLLALTYALRFPSTLVATGTVEATDKLCIQLSSLKQARQVRTGMPLTLTDSGVRVWQGHVERAYSGITAQGGHYTVRVACHIPTQVERNGVRYLYAPGDRLTLELRGDDVRLIHLLFQR